LIQPLVMTIRKNNPKSFPFTDNLEWMQSCTEAEKAAAAREYSMYPFMALHHDDVSIYGFT
jgi:hypothetical protein